MKDYNKILEEYIKNGCVGDLDLSESNIESLSNNLTLDGDIYLNRCIKLTSIGDNLKVSGKLNLWYCEYLTSLGDNIEVGGNLELWGCKNLTALPDNLKVSGNLNLRWSNIKTLPPTLEVKGSVLVNKDFNIERYIRDTFIKTMEGKQAPIIEGEIITGDDIIYFDFGAYLRGTS